MKNIFIPALSFLLFAAACGENAETIAGAEALAKDTSFVVEEPDDENPVYLQQVADSLLAAEEISAARDMYTRALAADSLHQVQAQDGPPYHIDDTRERLKIKASLRACNLSLEGMPFIGTKSLGEFWMAGAGEDFIQLYSIVIKPGAEVYLVESHYFPNEDREEEVERTLAGKYSPIMPGTGRFADGEYYQITATSFRLVDKEGKPLLLPGCCNQHDFAETGAQNDCDCGEIKFNV